MEDIIESIYQKHPSEEQFFTKKASRLMVEFESPSNDRNCFLSRTKQNEPFCT